MSVSVGESLCQCLWQRVYASDCSDCGKESMPVTVGRNLTASLSVCGRESMPVTVVTVAKSLCQ